MANDPSQNDPTSISDDAFLDGALQILQPIGGYRAGMDAVMLASSISLGTNQSLLDVGAGVGVGALSIARRLGWGEITCLEIQESLVGLARSNCQRNGLSNIVSILHADALARDDRPRPHAFDQVMTNPPFYERDSSWQLGPPDKTAAHVGENGFLDRWIRACLRYLKPGGTFTMIYPPGSLPRVLSVLAGPAGDIVVFPLWRRTGKGARRVIIRATKGARGPLRLSAGLSLHGEGRDYAPEAEEILRGRAALSLEQD
jgi:tRNA1(Val) A37 N6-methylase TrmN6